MSELRQLLEDLFNGRKPIKRQHPEPGQSQWYYMMPKSDEDCEDEYDIIDVPSETTPNPRLQQSLLSQTRTPTPVLTSHLEFNGQELAWYDNGNKIKS